MASLSIRKNSPLRVTYRWFSGRPLDGERRTDCTALRPGVKQLSRHPLRPWSYLPGWKRSVIRQAALFGFPLLIAAWFLYRPYVLAAVALVALAGGVFLWMRVRAILRDWHVDRRYVRPIHTAVGHALDLPPSVAAADYINVPREFLTDPRTPIRITLPDTFNATPENEERIGGLLLQKLDLAKKGTHTYETDTVGTPVMTIKYEPVPPATVGVNDPDMLAAIDAAGPSELVIGRTASGIYKVDLASESPHWGFSCESGTGKSSLFQVLAAQIVRKNPNNQVIGLDPKQASLAPVAGLPNVRIYTRAIGAEVEQMWAAVAEVKNEVIRRGDVLNADPTAEFDMLALVIDEINFLSVLTKSHWAKVKGPQDPKNAPFWDDLLIILAAGRQFRVHVLIAGQDLRETALGGIGLRTMIGLRGIAGYDAQMWVRFMQSRPIPRVPDKVGRWYYQVKGKRSLVQNAYGKPQEIVDLGRAGRPLSPVPALSLADARDTVPGDTQRGQEETPLVTGLKAGAAYLGMSYEGFKKARQRAIKAGAGIPGEITDGNQPAWTRETLDAFASKQEVTA